MAAWFIAMALFPEVQRKAQEEIDRVTGGNRLPGYQDREGLPYINAMVKEAVRWHSVVPMNLAHVSIQDGSAEGYVIPKGSQVLTNLWCIPSTPTQTPLFHDTWTNEVRAFTHDPNIYSDPMAFRPERFIDTATHKAERDPYYLSFGFGRRVCPGRTLADANIYISMALAVAAFNIGKPVRHGREVEVKLDPQPGLISHPAPVELDIKPRSQVHERLIRNVETDYPWEQSHADLLNSLAF